MNKDLYLANPSLLKGQPKRTISDYIEQNNILVPKRYDTSNDALNSGKPFYMRSESEVEYNGPSGLLESVLVSEEIIKEAQEFEAVRDKTTFMSHHQRLNPFLSDFKNLSGQELETKLYEVQKGHFDLKIFCDFTNTTEDKLQKSISYSYWEEIEGYNQAIVADSTIKGRYHIFTGVKRYSREERKSGIELIFDHPNYTIVDDSKILFSGMEIIPSEFAKDIPNIIDFYENIRHLPNFDANHCPIIEFQTDYNMNHYFLQYHRTRDFEESNFTLDREPEKDEMIACFVRGKTEPGGIIVNAPNYYTFSCYKNNFKQIDDNYAIIDRLQIRTLSELITKQTKIQFVRYSMYNMSSVIGDHLSKSIVFKPEISLGIDPNEFQMYTNEEYKKMFEDYNNGVLSGAKFRVISDGRKAYVKRVGPLEIFASN